MLSPAFCILCSLQITHTLYIWHYNACIALHCRLACSAAGCSPYVYVGIPNMSSKLRVENFVRPYLSVSEPAGLYNNLEKSCAVMIPTWHPKSKEALMKCLKKARNSPMLLVRLLLNDTVQVAFAARRSSLRTPVHARVHWCPARADTRSERNRRLLFFSRSSLTRIHSRRLQSSDCQTGCTHEASWFMKDAS